MMLDVSRGFVREAQQIPFCCEIEIEPQEIIGDTVTYENVLMNGTYSVTDDTVLVEGTLECAAHGLCPLCLNPVSLPIQIEFSEVFRRGANELEEEVFAYEGKSIDVTKLAVTLLLLNTPLRFPCEKDHSAEEAYLGSAPDLPQPEEEEDTFRPFEGLQAILNEKEET